MSDQMLMAGYILQAFEHGGMPMHAAGYRELAQWAAAELDLLDIETLRQMRHSVPGALLALIDNSLHARINDAGAVARRREPSAGTVCRALLQRLGARS